MINLSRKEKGKSALLGPVGGAYRIDMQISSKGYYITLPELFTDPDKATEAAREEASLTGCPCRVRRIPTWAKGNIERA